MKRTILAIIKKTGVLSLLVKIASPFCTRAHGFAPAAGEAIQILNGFSPDAHTSSRRPSARIVARPLWDLDIIIPCYNAEKTLRKCLDSCLEQKTGYLFRLIAVDDGSTDSTPSILDGYKDRANVLIVHQQNKGHGGARNAGLERICSSYLMFVDSDDFLMPGAIEKLMSAAMREKAALVEGGYAVVDKTGRMIHRVPGRSGEIDPTKAGALIGQSWAKVFRSSLFRNIQFPESYLYEDTINRMILYDLIAQTGQRSCGISDCVYCYYSDNPENITHSSVHRPACLDTFYVTVSLFEDRKKFGLAVDQDFYEYILTQIKLNCTRTWFMPPEIQKALFVVTREFYMRNFTGYHTNTERMMPLERALKEGNFKLYKVASCLTLT